MSDVTTIEADIPERYAEGVSTRLQPAADDDTNRVLEEGSSDLDPGSLSEPTDGHGLPAVRIDVKDLKEL